MRLVPNQNIDLIIQDFRSFLQNVYEELQLTSKLGVEIISRQPAWLGDPNSSAFMAAEKAIASQWGVRPLYIREGGSLPTSKFLQEEIQAPIVHMPFGQATDRAHLDNENIQILSLNKGKDVFKSFIAHICDDEEKEN